MLTRVWLLARAEGSLGIWVSLVTNNRKSGWRVGVVGRGVVVHVKKAAVTQKSDYYGMLQVLYDLIRNNISF